MGLNLAEDLVEDAKHLAAKDDAEQRESCTRRAVSTAYYAVFHLLIEDFVSNWPYDDERVRLARMFSHQKMRDAPFAPIDKKNPTLAEHAVASVRVAFGQLQSDRHRADYDVSWKIIPTEAAVAVAVAEDIFTQWRSIWTEFVARYYLLSLFGANR